MSGNNLKITFLLLLFVLGACKNMRVPAKAETHKAKAPAKTENKSAIGAAKTRYFRGKKFSVPKFTNDFNVALILPFRLDQADIDKSPLSRIMLDYYEGVLMAAAALEQRGIIMKLYVYDNHNDTTELRRLLKKPEMKNMDLIIGPVLKEQLNIMSAFSRSNQIPMISPLTSYSDLVAENRYYYNCTPTDKTKAKQMAEYMNKRFADMPVYIIHDGQKADKAFGNELAPLLNSKHQVKSITYARKMPLTEINDKSSDTALVIIPSKDRTVVSWCLGRLVAKQNIVVFGMDDWLELKNNDYQFWEQLQVHIPSNFYIQEADTAVKTFRQLYREKYKGEPSQFVFQGYDQALFFGEALLTFGPTFPDYISNTTFPYMNGAFNFRNNGRCFENYGVYILKFEGYQMLPVNHP